MDGSRLPLPHVDRANSTLFKRYLDEQHKSVVTTNSYQQVSRPINSTIYLSHVQHQQQISHDTRLDGSTRPITLKRKYSSGRKPPADISKQRISHTSRFMRRFQRQHKTIETTTNVQKRGSYGRPRFEFCEPGTTSKPTRPEQDTRCTCSASTSRDREEPQHHHHHPSHSPMPPPLPRLSLNELFRSSREHDRPALSPTHRAPVSKSPPPVIPTTIIEPGQPTSNPPPIDKVPSTIESATTLLDPPLKQISPVDLSREHWSILDDILQEISSEMTDKPSVDALLEIEGSLAQRIYECVVEQDDETEHDTKSFTTTTTRESSVPPPSNNIVPPEPLDLPPSPVSAGAREPGEYREQYFQPIRERPPPFDNLLDRSRHSTPFNRLIAQVPNDTRSPFVQSLLEPVTLLRSVAPVGSGADDDFNFFPSSFSFDNPSTTLKLPMFQQQPPARMMGHNNNSEPSTAIRFPVPLINHLLPPQTSVDVTSSAFKPIEPAAAPLSTSFSLRRPQVLSGSTTNWFGRS